jgi:beta-N-acetylhexosaminidase
MKNGDVPVELDIETRKQIGQMFLIGFQGLTMSPEIRHLIEYYFIGNIIFARRNITGIVPFHVFLYWRIRLTMILDSQQTAKLIHELQQTARDAGHTRPLLIALDQEHGMVYPIRIYLPYFLAFDD